MVDEILKKENLSRDDLLKLIAIEDNNELNKLFKAAYDVKLKYVGNEVYYRGLIEFSNICAKNCLYCGIRNDNKNFTRYSMSFDEILDMALWAYKNNYGSVTLQSGERTDDEFVSFVTEVIKGINKETDGKLGITLCLGEQERKTYKMWFDAGATRYLLRIETSNLDLYKKIHPDDGNHIFEVRKQCLKTLKDIGYQVGTGVMIGLPDQSSEDLVNDILFFKENDIDMIGMGPYVVQSDTPMGKSVLKDSKNTRDEKTQRFELGLKMIALTRLYLKDVNIAATTALQALNPLGRELGLKAGANILMPIITLKDYRESYQLYDDKPCINDSADDCKECLSMRISSVGDTIGYGKLGDSPHFMNKNK